MNTVIVALTRPGAIVPTCATDGSAGFDLYSPEGFYLKAGDTCTINLGVCFTIPTNLWMEVRSRSGLAFKYDITSYHGVIDSDYRKEVHVKLTNDGQLSHHIYKGDRIAQAVFHERPAVQLVVGDVLESSRGGFGSTGR